MIARWDGTSWSPVGSGAALAGGEGISSSADRAGETPAIYSLAVTKSDGQQSLVAGGTFVSIDGIVARRVAQWDGVAWNALNGGMSDPVYALEAHDDGSGVRLYAGGTFETAGSAVARHLARWDGSNWSSWILPLTELSRVPLGPFASASIFLIAEACSPPALTDLLRLACAFVTLD